MKKSCLKGKQIRSFHADMRQDLVMLLFRLAVRPSVFDILDIQIADSIKDKAKHITL